MIITIVKSCLALQLYFFGMNAISDFRRGEGTSAPEARFKLGYKSFVKTNETSHLTAWFGDAHNARVTNVQERLK